MICGSKRVPFALFTTKMRVFLRCLMLVHVYLFLTMGSAWPCSSMKVGFLRSWTMTKDSRDYAWFVQEFFTKTKELLEGHNLTEEAKELTTKAEKTGELYKELQSGSKMNMDAWIGNLEKLQMHKDMLRDILKNVIASAKQLLGNKGPDRDAKNLEASEKLDDMDMDEATLITMLKDMEVDMHDGMRDMMKRAILKALDKAISEALDEAVKQFSGAEHGDEAVLANQKFVREMNTMVKEIKTDKKVAAEAQEEIQSWEDAIERVVPIAFPDMLTIHPFQRQYNRDSNVKATGPLL